MEKQYLIVAEQLSFRNNKLTAINIWDQFTALHLPAKFNFDLVFICGPGWQPGEYNLTFKVKSEASEIFDLGSINVNIANDKSVFNAIASNLNFVIEKNAGNVTFIVDRNGEEVFSREYPVNYLLDIKRKAEVAAV
ncbi:MAG: hypothetical protein V2B14_00185 [bacterium]